MSFIHEFEVNKELLKFVKVKNWINAPKLTCNYCGKHDKAKDWLYTAIVMDKENKIDIFLCSDACVNDLLNYPKFDQFIMQLIRDKLQEMQRKNMLDKKINRE